MFVFDPTISSAVKQAEAVAPKKQPQPDGAPISAELLAKMDRYWRAGHYLTVWQIFLRGKTLLPETLPGGHIKTPLLGPWGTSLGQNFILGHLNRLIKENNASVIYISGPGHGGPSLNAHSYLEGTYSEVHPDITQDDYGMKLLFKRFSSPGGVGSHCGPHVPNSIHEGGELGYSLMHAFGAAFDNPELIVACVIGGGEAESWPLEGSWKGNMFLNPIRDGAVLPILHLNGYKISSPTVEARTPDEELAQLYRGRGYKPYFVEGSDPGVVHQAFASALNSCYSEIRAIQADVRKNGLKGRPTWSMIILRTPKGWTGPKEVDGLPIEGTFRAHQVPLATVRENPEHLRMLEAWMRSYKPEELFDAEGRLVA